MKVLLKRTNILLILLVALNLFLLFLLSQGPRQNGQNHQKGLSILKKTLQLTDAQVTQVKALRTEHFESVEDNRNALKQKKEKLFELMVAEPYDTIVTNELLMQIGTLESKRDQLLVEHYQKLKAVCTPKQKKKLKIVFQKAFLKKSPKGKLRR